MEDYYTYIKGSGWVLGPDCDHYECEVNGIKLEFEHRKPNPGERFYYLFKEFYIVDGGMNWTKLVGALRWALLSEWANAALCPEIEKQDEHFRYAYQFDNDKYTHVVMRMTRTT